MIIYIYTYIQCMYYNGANSLGWEDTPEYIVYMMEGSTHPTQWSRNLREKIQCIPQFPRSNSDFAYVAIMLKNNFRVQFDPMTSPRSKYTHRYVYIYIYIYVMRMSIYDSSKWPFQPPIRGHLTTSKGLFLKNLDISGYHHYQKKDKKGL